MEENNNNQYNLTLSEYQDRYSSRMNNKFAKYMLFFVISIIGVIVFVLLFLLCKEAYEWNEYVGYGAIAVSVLIFIFLFLVPVIRIVSLPRFQVDVNAYTARSAKRHNRALRRHLADSIIELYVSTAGSGGLYTSSKVEALMKARKEDREEGLMKALDDIYLVDIKKSANQIITSNSVKSGLLSAVSQKDTSDALIVTLINLKMIKDLVYLYGFRPSDARLLKIFSSVMANALISYGLGSVNIGGAVAKSIGGVVESIPILGSAISIAIDSSIQGLSNSILTATIGRQTISYLNKEYHLQEVLERVKITESDEEFALQCEEVKKELVAAKKNKNKTPKPVEA
ncbi:MAG: DUF697 domain-containing protein [Bacilli bacterium]|nr:DUF697 domain-containing protein [Bacilli bacterium]